MDNHHLLRVQVEKIHEENYKHMKIVVGILEVSSPFHILFPLFGIPLLIHLCHSSQVICEILRLWYSKPLYSYNISFYNYN